jgi:hypothetical protein
MVNPTCIVTTTNLEVQIYQMLACRSARVSNMTIDTAHIAFDPLVDSCQLDNKAAAKSGTYVPLIVNNVSIFEVKWYLP